MGLFVADRTLAEGKMIDIDQAVYHTKELQTF